MIRLVDEEKFLKEFLKNLDFLSSPRLAAQDAMLYAPIASVYNVLPTKWYNVKKEGNPREEGEYIVCCNDCECQIDPEDYKKIPWMELPDEGIWYQRDTVVQAHYFGDGCWEWEDNGTAYDISFFVTHWTVWPKPPAEVYL